MTKINKDYTYCSGIQCKIRQTCKRYLKNPPINIDLYWICPAYSEEKNSCPMYRNVFEGTSENVIV